MTAIRFVVRGRVQGVGYRRFAVAAAQRLGIGGRVRNAADGTVQGTAEGDDAALAAFAAALRQGPTFAAVAAVEVTAAVATGIVDFRAE